LAAAGNKINVLKPQLAVAEAQVARASLELERTELRAPFDAVVLREEASVGQLTGPGVEVAVLIGARRLWVEGAIRMEQIEHVAIPGVNAEAGSLVRVRPGRAVEVASRLNQRVREWC
jgi:multidrug resistance efflux pump